MLLKFLSLFFVASSALAQTIAADTVTVKDKILFFNTETSVPVVYYTAGRSAPTIIMGHGCNGTFQSWPDRVRSWGYNVVVPNSFTARGHSNICNNTRLVTPEQRTRDIEEVAKWVTQQSWHSGKIGFMGFSHGGWTGQYLASNSDANIAAVVNYYPYCDYQDRNPKIPVQIHIGEQDDWTPAARCKSVSNNSKYDLHVYADAYHGFEVGLETVSAGHRISYNSTASKLAEQRSRDFFERYVK